MHQQAIWISFFFYFMGPPTSCDGTYVSNVCCCIEDGTSHNRNNKYTSEINCIHYKCVAVASSLYFFFSFFPLYVHIFFRTSFPALHSEKMHAHGGIFISLLPLKGRLHELKRGLFSALKLSDLLHSTGPKLKLKRGPMLAHVYAPL